MKAMIELCHQGREYPVLPLIVSVVAIVMPMVVLSVGIAAFIYIMHSYNMEYGVFSLMVVLMMMLLAGITYYDLRRWQMAERLFTDLEIRLFGDTVTNKDICKCRRKWLRDMVAVGQNKADIFAKIDRYHANRINTPVDLTLYDKDRYKHER